MSSRSDWELLPPHGGARKLGPYGAAREDRIAGEFAGCPCLDDSIHDHIELSPQPTEFEEDHYNTINPAA